MAKKVEEGRRKRKKKNKKSNVKRAKKLDLGDSKVFDRGEKIEMCNEQAEESQGNI